MSSVLILWAALLKALSRLPSLPRARWAYCFWLINPIQRLCQKNSCSIHLRLLVLFTVTPWMICSLVISPSTLLMAPVLTATAWELVKLLMQQHSLQIQNCPYQRVFLEASLATPITILRFCLQSASILTCLIQHLGISYLRRCKTPFSVVLVQLRFALTTKRETAAIRIGLLRSLVSERFFLTSIKRPRQRI